MTTDNYDEDEQLTELPESEAVGQYLTFFIADQIFGAPIADVLQIVGLQKITEIPDSPPYAMGVINLRGEIIPIVDMRIKLNRENAVNDDRTCIVLSKINDSVVGLIVDRVNEVLDISGDLISLPANIANNTKSYLMGVARVQEKVILLINLQKAMEEDLEWANRAAKG